MAKTIGEYRVEFSASTSKLTNTLKTAKGKVTTFAGDVQTKVGGFVQNVIGIGTSFLNTAASVGQSVTSIVNDVTAAGSQIAKISKQLGLPAEDVSALGFAAERSGVSMEAMTSGLSSFTGTIESALKSPEQYAGVFDKIGVALTDSEDKLKPTRELLLDTADAISQRPQNEQASLAQQLFGDNGAELLPLLQQGRQGITDLTDKAEQLGVVWSNEQAQRAENMRTAMEGVKQAVSSIKETWSGLMKDVVIKLMPDWTNALNKVTDWLVKHRKDIEGGLIKIWGLLESAISACWNVFIKLGESGVLDACLRGLKIFFITISTQAQLAYYAIRMIISAVKDVILSIFQAEKTAKLSQLKGDAKKSEQKAQLYSEIATSQIGMDDISQEHLALKKRKEEGGLSSADMERFELLGEVREEHFQWKSQAKRDGKDTRKWEEVAGEKAGAALANAEAKKKLLDERKETDWGQKYTNTLLEFPKELAEAATSEDTLRPLFSGKTWENKDAKGAESKGEAPAAVEKGATHRAKALARSPSAIEEPGQAPNREVQGGARPDLAQRPTAGQVVDSAATMVPSPRPVASSADEEGTKGLVQNITVHSGDISPVFNWPDLTEQIVREKVWPVLKNLMCNAQTKPLDIINSR